MRWFWKKKKPKFPELNEALLKDHKILDRIDTEKVKGGRKNTNRIWNGCGGTIPQ